MEDIYATVGTEVIVGFHNSTGYTGSMSKYAGFKARIHSVIRNEYNKLLWCLVDADEGDYWWPVCDMILASDTDLLTEEKERFLELAAHRQDRLNQMKNGVLHGTNFTIQSQAR